MILSRQDPRHVEEALPEATAPPTGRPRVSAPSSRFPLEILVFPAGLAAYFATRYNGIVGQNDVIYLVEAARAAILSGRVVPDDAQFIYSSGYGFTALLAFINTVSGLAPADITALLQPFLVVIIAVVAFALYREFSADAWSARLGVVLLLLQPEFLFAVLRGTHEIYTRTLLMLAFLLLARSVRLSEYPRLLALQVALFYTAVYSLISINVFFASSYIAALFLAVTGGWLWARFRRTTVRTAASVLERLALASASCFVLVYLFMEHIYPPAGQHWRIITQTATQISQVVFSVEETTNPYSIVQTLWINQWIYLTLTTANWLVLLASSGLWLRRTWRWMRYGEGPATAGRWLLWLFWAAFAAQGALAILVDSSSDLLGKNAQHRLFPSFATVAVGQIVVEAGGWLRAAHVRSLSVRAATACILMFLTVAALAKATNEPTVGNRWVFCRPEELVALRWTDSHLVTTSLWTDYDERLKTCGELYLGQPTHNNVWDTYAVEPETRDVLITEVTRLRSKRLALPLPDPVVGLRVYDNGTAELYHQRSLTPFQR